MSVACHFSNLSITLKDKPLFHSINATLLTQPQGLVAPNGQGKSVLLNLLAGVYTADSGNIHWQQPFYFVPQLTRLNGNTLADALGITLLMQSFQRIENGIADEDDFEHVDNKWDHPTRWQTLLASAGLDKDLTTPITSLSGGEQTRLALCRAFFTSNNFLLLDEPSNHLDNQGRQLLLKLIQQHTGGVLIASHDRTLLECVNTVFELTTTELKEYGGNYNTIINKK